MSDKARKRRIRISNKKCAKRAGVSVRTLARWEVNSAVAYPKGHLVCGRFYRWLDEVESWERANPGFGRPDRDED